MKGDFSRDTYDRRRQFTRVLFQQGRVLVDADWNEQADIIGNFLRTITADVIGPHGGPTGETGFGVSVDTSALSEADLERLDIDAGASLPAGDFLIGPGRYYVGGLLVENAEVIRFLSQPDLPGVSTKPDASTTVIVYLDVWERHITSVEHRRLREVALGGPDTASRAQIVSQAKFLKTDKALSDIKPNDVTSTKFSAEEQRILRILALMTLIHDLKHAKNAAERKDLGDRIKALKPTPSPGEHVRLRARARTASVPFEPCNIQPDARYRGAENQLYRVEVHRSGVIAGDPTTDATFKWSRENGSVVFPIHSLAEKEADVTSTGRDARFGLQVGNWVSVEDDESVLQNRADRLVQVKNVKGLKVTFDVTPEAGHKPHTHRLIRRWDHHGESPLSDGAIVIVEGEGDNDGWFTLEDGVQVQFQKPPANSPPNFYSTGDYWVIPARTATGDVEWPGPSDDPKPLPPRGVRHAYAPIARVSTGANGEVKTSAAGDDLRLTFDPLA